MKREFYWLAAVGLVVLFGCVQQPQPPPNNTLTNTNHVNIFGPSQVPGATEGCLETEQVPVRVDIVAPTAIPVGASAGIDATPKSAAGKRSDICNESQGILWGTNDQTLCVVAAPSSFTTSLKCLKVGSCSLAVQVPGKGASGASVVACQ